MAFALTSDIPRVDPAWHRRHDHPYFNEIHCKLQRFVREYDMIAKQQRKLAHP